MIEPKAQAMNTEESHTCPAQGDDAWLGAVSLFLLAVLLLLPAGCSCFGGVEQGMQEPIYEADVNTVNPALDGKLVKLKISALHTDAVVKDPLFGVQGNYLSLSRDVVEFGGECEGELFCTGEAVDVEWTEGEMDGIRSCRVSPSTMRSGAFTVLHAGRFLSPTPQAALLPLPPREQWPAVLQQKGDSGQDNIILWYQSAAPDAEYAHLRFRALAPGELPEPLYAVARQRGNTLNMNDHQATVLTFKEFNTTHNTGHLNRYNGIELALCGTLALVCTPLAWLALAAGIRLWRTWRTPANSPRFSPRLTALLYLPLITLIAGTLWPFWVNLQHRWPLAVAAVLYALLVRFLTRPHRVCPPNPSLHK